MHGTASVGTPNRFESGPHRASLACTDMRTLLVADADWVRNDVLAGLDGHDIMHADDPATVADYAGSVDLVIADMQVGSMGGMAITRAVKDAWLRAGMAPVPIVLLLDRSADEFLARRSGADGWLTKPFTAQDLRSTLEATLAGSS